MRFALRTPLASALALLTAVAGWSLAGTQEKKEPADLVAVVGDTKITRAELLDQASDALVKIRQQEYEVLQDYLERMIENRLVEAAAAKEGKSSEEYLAEKVDAKVADPTDEEIKAFYDQNKSRMQGKSLDEMKGRISDYLKSRKRQETYKALIAELKKATKVRVFLDPPRVEIDEGDNPAIGPANAPVKIIEFSDFQCPYCQRAKGTLEKLREHYGNKIRIVFRDFPLSFHQNAEKAAEAAGCAYEQGKFWEMHDKLFENQRALEVEKLYTYAEQIGLDQEAFKECLDSGRRSQEVRADIQAGQKVGVQGTPAFFINGRFVSGAQPYENFAKIIDEELARLEPQN
ncbi:MAG: hypothetical protein D6718_10145 [Acidobacteria bacterium]|nr:MAG: hypothetical protein D6718_10145 [Acidobacteriota bacterium]